ncbi:hypothetical protein Tsubulata_023530 [Turnera subulata]|uniref:Uncharacterized protein n=1 Tax=Turnera subulata TaxID=218843 RepID=A0A9Q0GEC8_9ROSI|nr:hypothetical protein Tsubulata_023530 [Turnera subulata]
MPSFPQPGSVTVCEINRELITADALSDDRAKETYGKILGTVFSPIPFQPEPSASTGEEQGLEQPERRTEETVERKGLLQSLQAIVKGLFNPNSVHLLPDVDLQGVSWHPHKHIIAFISGSNQVTIRDYEDSEGKDACILSSVSQQDVKVIEWRPNGGKSLSVACKQVSILQHFSYVDALQSDGRSFMMVKYDQGINFLDLASHCWHQLLVRAHRSPYGMLHKGTSCLHHCCE